MTQEEQLSKRNYGSLSFWITNAVYILMIACAWYISSNLSVDGFIAKENAISVLKSLLDVDIALVAFFGLVLVLNLNYIIGTKDRTSREKLEMNIQRDKFQLRLFDKIRWIEFSHFSTFPKGLL